MRLLNQFHECVRHEVVPAIHADLGGQQTPIVTAGRVDRSLQRAGHPVPLPGRHAHSDRHERDLSAASLLRGSLHRGPLLLLAGRLPAQPVGTSARPAARSVSSFWPPAKAHTRTSASRGPRPTVLGRKGVPNRVDPWGDRSGRTSGRPGARCCRCTSTSSARRGAGRGLGTVRQAAYSCRSVANRSVISMTALQLGVADDDHAVAGDRRAPVAPRCTDRQQVHHGDVLAVLGEQPFEALDRG